MICPICNNKINNDYCPNCHYTMYHKRGIIKKWFEKKDIQTDELIKHVDDFLKTYWQLSNRDTYISRKEYQPILDEYIDTYKTIQNLKETKTIVRFCKKNEYHIDNIQLFCDLYANFPNKIDELNNQFINIHMKKDQEYLKSLLKEVDSAITLDEDQRRAILNDEDYILIIAGAGAGKTTTIAGKVKYLVERKGILPEEILVISYTNKAVKELRERINDKLHIPCKIATFHATGNEIVQHEKSESRKIVSDNYWYIKKYLSEMVSNDLETLKKLILFFGYYLDIPDISFDVNNLEKYFQYRERNAFLSMKSNLSEVNETFIDINSKKKVTINNELLRSTQEVQIANFLYLHNIDYEYEKPYKYRIENSNKIYTPDFYIKQNDKEAYIEHFGISESGNNSMYTKNQLDQYKSRIFDKIAIHKKYNTTLIYTYSSYNDGRSLLEHLKEELINKGFILHKRKDKEVYDKIIATENEKYIWRFARLASLFIHNFKTNDYNENDFSVMKMKTNNARTLLFIDIIEKVYLYYQQKLKEENAVDFEDMINESARLLREVKTLKYKLPYKYVIIDEYQDISHQRFNLAKELAEVTDAKIIAVGDDWQSIYAFAGSDITLFTDFKKQMGYGVELKITKTYRNSQELIDIAGNFIQKNSLQIKKQLTSDKSIRKPVVILSYNDDPKSNKIKGKNGVLYAKAKLLSEVIGKIIKADKKCNQILLLGRYGFDGEQLIRTEFFEFDRMKRLISKEHPQAQLQFMTAHSSKGLGADNVIIINASNDVYGFPSQIDDDPVMKLVTKVDESMDFAEERRLFYVALTRTKNRVFILTPEKRPSQFVIELINDYPNITVHGNISNEIIDIKKDRKICPKCGYPLLIRANKAYQQKLYVCTNDPELCDFVTNDIRGNGNIHCCSKCNGYMIVKKQKDKDNYFMGCTNYLPNGKGCNNVENIDYSGYIFYKEKQV